MDTRSTSLLPRHGPPCSRHFPHVEPPRLFGFLSETSRLFLNLTYSISWHPWKKKKEIPPTQYSTKRAFTNIAFFRSTGCLRIMHGMTGHKKDSTRATRELTCCLLTLGRSGFMHVCCLGLAERPGPTNFFFFFFYNFGQDYVISASISNRTRD